MTTMTPARRSWATLREEFHDLPATLAVERGSGFVGEDQAGLVGQGAGDGDALLFAAGERFGEIVGARADAEVVEQLHARAAGRPAGQRR